MKQVAKTLKEMKDDSVMGQVLDRTMLLSDDVIDEILGWWSFDLLKRKAGLALDGIAYGLDLSTVLYEFAKRKMVVNFPTYHSMRGSTITEGQNVVSKENRHGPILRLNANKDMFSFSVLTNDANVMGTDSVGAFRSFAVVGLTGEFDATWERIEFMPPKDIKDHFNDEGLGNHITVKHFVHPARRSQVYGQYYVKTMAAYQRLQEELEHLSFLKKRFEHEGIVRDEGEKKEWPKSTTDYSTTKKVSVPAFEMILHIPNMLPHPVAKFVGKQKSPSQWEKFKGKQHASRWDEWVDKRNKLMDAFSDVPWFPELDANDLDFIEDRIKYLRYDLLPTLNFLLRSAELAFCKYGKGATADPVMPPWIKTTRVRDAWNPGFTIPALDREIEGFKSTKPKVSWDRLVLFQDKIGEYGTSLLKRTFEKNQTVNVNYDFTYPEWFRG